MEIALLIGQLLLKFGPGVASEFQLLFTKKEITQEDWNKIFAMAAEPWKEMKTPTVVENVS